MRPLRQGAGYLYAVSATTSSPSVRQVGHLAKFRRIGTLINASPSLRPVRRPSNPDCARRQCPDRCPAPPPVTRAWRGRPAPRPSPTLRAALSCRRRALAPPLALSLRARSALGRGPTRHCCLSHSAVRHPGAAATSAHGPARVSMPRRSRWARMRRTTGCSVMNATIDIAPPRGTRRRRVQAHLDLHFVYEPQPFGLSGCGAHGVRASCPRAQATRARPRAYRRAPRRADATTPGASSRRRRSSARGSRTARERGRPSGRGTRVPRRGGCRHRGRRCGRRPVRLGRAWHHGAGATRRSSRSSPSRSSAWIGGPMWAPKPE